MKVELFDETGALIGTAYHEDNWGTVQMPPAARDYVATYILVNGQRWFIQPCLVSKGKEQMIRVPKPRNDSYEQHLQELLNEREKEVDKAAPKVTWWGRIKMFLWWIS